MAGLCFQSWFLNSRLGLLLPRQLPRIKAVIRKGMSFASILLGGVSGDNCRTLGRVEG